jgi:hypothetical protein
LNELYQLFNNNINLIDIIDKIIYYFHTQNYDKALRNSTIFINKLDSNMLLIQQIAGQERLEILTGMLTDLFAAQNNKDYVLQADLYELQVRRYFRELQQDIVASEGFIPDENIYINNQNKLNQTDPALYELISSGVSHMNIEEQGYEVEFTSSGAMTVAILDKQGRYYMHSNSSASKEGFTLAKSWYKEDITEYIVYGYGLGYHIKELIDIDSSISIEIYEADINMLKLAAAYSNLADVISKPTINLIFDPDHSQLLKKLTQLNDDMKFVIHYPSLRNIKDANIKEKLENYFIQYSSIINQLKLLNGNFRRNVLCYQGLADELKGNFKDKDLFIIAAGPSLDKNFTQLHKVNRENSIILATGTVFKKMLSAGITPDYVIVTDPNERVYKQISGVETCQVPMLYLSTAFYGFAKNYHGKKYIILQKDYEKSEEFAATHGATLMNTGGSVSTTALDLGIALGSRRIIFLGLDLAYTGNYAHASETSRRNITVTNDLREVEDINGELIYTSRILDMYRQWIENRIQNTKGIEFVDATEGGARIKGMKIMKLSEVLEK